MDKKIKKKNYQEFLDAVKTTGVEVVITMPSESKDGKVDVLQGFYLPGDTIHESISEDNIPAYRPLIRQERRAAQRDREKNPVYSKPNGNRRVRRLIERKMKNQ